MELNSLGTIFTKSGQFACFADDMDIVARSFSTVAELFIRLKRAAAKVGLVDTYERPTMRVVKYDGVSSVEVVPTTDSKRNCDQERFSLASNAPYRKHL